MATVELSGEDIEKVELHPDALDAAIEAAYDWDKATGGTEPRETLEHALRAYMLASLKLGVISPGGQACGYVGPCGWKKESGHG